MDAEIKALRMKYKSLPDRRNQIINAIESVVESMDDCLADINLEYPETFDLRNTLNNLVAMTERLHRGSVDDLEDAIRYTSRFVELLRANRAIVGATYGVVNTYIIFIESSIRHAQQIHQLLNKQDWNNGTIVSMAREIIRTQQWEDCPILADALEDAGFNDSRVLNLLRTSRPTQLLRDTISRIAGS